MALPPYFFPIKRFHAALGFRFPLPHAGEGQGEGVSGRSSRQRGSLTLALSQRERERRPEHWRKALSCDRCPAWPPRGRATYTGLPLLIVVEFHHQPPN